MISVTVLVPTIRPEAPRLTGVPDIVTAGPPGDTATLATANPVGLAVNTWPATVKTGGTRLAVPICTANVLPPIMRLEDAILTGVPDIITAEPPSDTAVPAKLKPVELAVKAWPAAVNTEGIWFDEDARRGMVLPPTKTPEGPRLTGVPEMTAGGPPGDTVIPAMTKPVGWAVKIAPATVNTGGTKSEGDGWRGTALLSGRICPGFVLETPAPSIAG